MAARTRVEVYEATAADITIGGNHRAAWVEIGDRIVIHAAGLDGDSLQELRRIGDVIAATARELAEADAR